MTNYNKNFGIVNADKTLKCAPVPLVINGEKHWTNMEENYISQGYLPVIYSEEPKKEGFCYKPYFEQEGKTIVQKWEESEVTETEISESATDEEIQNAIKEGVNSIDS